MDDIKKFAKLIKDTKFVMFTTHERSSGQFHSRPMTLQQMEFDGDLWFFANRTSELEKQVEADARVNLNFVNVQDMKFLSAQGTAQVVIDKQKAKELWNPMHKAWFPRGVDDPELCLIKVSVDSADYWDSPGSTLVRMVGFAKAIMTGQKGDKALGEHGHLNIKQ